LPKIFKNIRDAWIASGSVHQTRKKYREDVRAIRTGNDYIARAKESIKLEDKMWDSLTNAQRDALSRTYYVNTGTSAQDTETLAKEMLRYRVEKRVSSATRNHPMKVR